MLLSDMVGSRCKRGSAAYFDMKQVKAAVLFIGIICLVGGFFFGVQLLRSGIVSEYTIHNEYLERCKDRVEHFIERKNAEDMNFTHRIIVGHIGAHDECIVSYRRARKKTSREEFIAQDIDTGAVLCTFDESGVLRGDDAVGGGVVVKTKRDYERCVLKTSKVYALFGEQMDADN